jgi:hypothetical protein
LALRLLVKIGEIDREGQEKMERFFKFSNDINNDLIADTTA